jgi:hypothetical protein
MVTAAGAIEDDAMSMLQDGRRETETAPGKQKTASRKTETKACRIDGKRRF